jgi:hypothetical protein
MQQIDCEGAEIDLIEGLSLKYARCIEQIALEFHSRDDYSTGDMVRKLTMLGFDVRVREQGGYIFARQKE